MAGERAADRVGAAGGTWGDLKHPSDPFPFGDAVCLLSIEAPLAVFVDHGVSILSGAGGNLGVGPKSLDQDLVLCRLGLDDLFHVGIKLRRIPGGWTRDASGLTISRCQVLS